MSSILSPINTSRFRLEHKYYGDGTLGSYFTFPQFTEHVREIIGIYCLLRTDHNVASRMLWLCLVRGLYNTDFAPAIQLQGSNFLGEYQFYQGAQTALITNSLIYPCAVPKNLYIIPDDVLAIKCKNQQANDKIEIVIAYWKVYPTGKP